MPKTIPVAKIPQPKTPGAVRHGAYPTSTPPIKPSKPSTRMYGKKEPKAPGPPDMSQFFGPMPGLK